MAQRRTAPMGARSNDQLRRPESSARDTADDMKSFYEDMERTDLLERKLSARKSVATSVWSPSPPKPTAPPASASTSTIPRLPSKPDLSGADSSNEAKSELNRTNRNSSHHIGSSRSVISETRENATWAEKGKWSDVPLHSVKVKYPLHNPMGPRWYRNHHLIPPSQKKPSMRPPTFFSPSFPPIHTSSSPANNLDSPEDYSATPAESPLPTPTSSQTRVVDGGKRSRKTSQTTPDNIDLLDVTDPWGQSWHHRSPYDFDFGNSPTATDPPVRPRRASTTAVPNKFQTVTPSPLSQSSSAVHLPPFISQIHVPRKLSKRRTPTAEAVFNPQPPPKVEHRKAASVPHTLNDTAHIMSSREHIPTESAVLPMRMSVAPPPAHSAMYQTPKKEKRGSMLNRLAKKFSLLRKSHDDEPPTLAGSEYWHRVESEEIQGYINSHPNGSSRRSASPNKSTRESVKRVPPPSEELIEPLAMPSAEMKTAADRVSLSSMETPISMGRLTIANPDAPDEEKEPAPLEAPAPSIPAPEPERLPAPVIPPESIFSPRPESVQLSPNDAWSRFEKPLPMPQLATPKFSELGLSVPDQTTPEIEEQLLPPPPPEKPSLDRGQAASSPAMSTPEGSAKRDTSDFEVPPQSPVEITVLETATSDATVRPLSPNEPLIAAETPKRSSSYVKAPPVMKDLPLSPETTPDRSRTRSPPMPQSWAQYETPEISAPVPSPTVTRKKTVSPDPQIVTKNLRESLSNAQMGSGPSRDAVPEASSSRRVSVKATRTVSRIKHSSKNPPAPVQVPVPTSISQTVPDPIANGSKTYTQQIYEASPMSTSSMLANPPTPYDDRLSITLTPDQSAPPSLPPKSIYEGKTAHNPSPLRTSAVNPSPSNLSPSRQTETFKLVRSSSGNVYASGQTIHAQGQQWEVVESVDSPKVRKDKTTSRHKDSEHRPRTQERRSTKDLHKEHEYKSRDHERRSKDYEYKSRDTEYTDDHRHRDHEHRPREHEHRVSSKEVERKSEYRSKDYDRSKDRERSKDHDKPKDYERSRDYDAPRSRESRDVLRDSERNREHERLREAERARETERLREAERAREAERIREAERVRESDRRREAERQRQERQREAERREADRAKEYIKSKDAERRQTEKDHNTRRESRRATQSPVIEVVPSTDYYRSSSYRMSKPAAPAPYAEEPAKVRSSTKTTSRRTEESKSSRPKEEYREKKHEQKSAPIPFPTSTHAPRPYVAPVQQAHKEPAPSIRLERIPSLTARPTSELPSAAEMNAIRAKESWDMERLWKARSMYGLEPNAPTSNFIHDAGSSSSKSDEVHTQSAVYGSSHTAYVVSSPFSGSGIGSQIYHSMPTGPPPIIYSSPASIPSIPDMNSNYDPHEPYRSYHTPQGSYQASPVDYRASSSMPRPPLSNPLPEPPREFPLDLKSTTKSTNRQSNEYWTKYNGITATH